MRTRKRLPRLTIRDWEELARAAAGLNAIAATIQRTNWQPAPAALAIVAGVYGTVARLYDKADAVITCARESAGMVPPGETSELGASSDAAAGDRRAV